MNTLLKASLTVLCVVGLAACDGGKSGGPGAPKDAGRDAGVVQDRGSFSLDVPMTETDIAPGETDVVTIGVDRGTGIDGAIQLSFTNVPQGVTISPATIPAGENEVEVTITAAAGAAAGEHTVTVEGRGPAGPPATNTFKIDVSQS
jgi:uncharacterized membrane protein